MSEGLTWNAPFYVAGALTLFGMLSWDRIVAWLERLAPSSPEARRATSRRTPVCTAKERAEGNHSRD